MWWRTRRITREILAGPPQRIRSVKRWSRRLAGEGRQKQALKDKLQKSLNTKKKAPNALGICPLCVWSFFGTCLLRAWSLLRSCQARKRFALLLERSNHLTLRQHVAAHGAEELVLIGVLRQVQRGIQGEHLEVVAVRLITGRRGGGDVAGRSGGVLAHHRALRQVQLRHSAFTTDVAAARQRSCAGRQVVEDHVDERLVGRRCVRVLNNDRHRLCASRRLRP